MVTIAAIEHKFEKVIEEIVPPTVGLLNFVNVVSKGAGGFDDKIVNTVDAIVHAPEHLPSSFGDYLERVKGNGQALGFGIASVIASYFLRGLWAKEKLWNGLEGTGYALIVSTVAGAVIDPPAGGSPEGDGDRQMTMNPYQRR